MAYAAIVHFHRYFPRLPGYGLPSQEQGLLFQCRYKSVHVWLLEGSEIQVGVRGAKEGNIQVTIQVGCRELIIYAKNNIAGLIIPCLVIGI